MTDATDKRDARQRRTREIVESLVPELRPLAVDLVASAADLGFRIALTEGRRTRERQQALYDQGRTLPGPVVTQAGPDQSPHCRGAAFDVAFLDADNSLSWADEWPWDAVGAIGEGLGLVWGGRWRGKRRDRPHFELSDWRALPVPS